jgi:ankyrin repeat protein
MKKIIFIILCLLLTPAFFAYAANSEQNEKLIQATMSGNLGDVDTALTSGADINTKNADGKTALWIALDNGHTDVVKDLSIRVLM